MTHEGRMKRGQENVTKGLLDNEDTKYFLANQPKPEPQPEPKLKPKKEKVKDGDN